MLDRKGKVLNLKEVGLTPKTIDVDAQRMSGQFRVQTGAQAPEGVSVVLLRMELLGQLAVHRLDDLPHTSDARRYLRGQLPSLVGAGHSHQAEAVALKESVHYRFRNVLPPKVLSNRRLQ